MLVVVHHVCATYRNLVRTLLLQATLLHRQELVYQPATTQRNAIYETVTTHTETKHELSIIALHPDRIILSIWAARGVYAADRGVEISINQRTMQMQIDGGVTGIPWARLGEQLATNTPGGAGGSAHAMGGNEGRELHR